MTITDGFRIGIGITLSFGLLYCCIVAGLMLIVVGAEIFDLLFSKTWRAYRLKQLSRLFGD